jgi:hypothetical protein
MSLTGLCGFCHGFHKVSECPSLNQAHAQGGNQWLPQAGSTPVSNTQPRILESIAHVPIDPKAFEILIRELITVCTECGRLQAEIAQTKILIKNETLHPPHQKAV